MRILLVTPPMTQLNTPYPATVYLTGFLRRFGFDAAQADPALELVLRLFSRDGLAAAHEELVAVPKRGRRAAAPGSAPVSSAVRFFLEHAATYIGVVDAAVR